jgi:acyl-[acyl-carrier-protein] desaturase
VTRRAFDEAVYREYMEFFAQAERKRRWSVFDDVPWERLDGARVDERRVLCAETFCAVEMFLPDYVAEGIGMARDCFGHAWFHANWAYEESKHSLALREYLVRSGQRTPEQMYAFERSVLARRWHMPFRDSRQMVCYGAIQEAATFVIYRKQLAAAEQAQDEVLAAIYRLIARDEAAHAGFYVQVLKAFIDEDRAGAAAALGHVLRNFTMPAYDLIEDYENRVAVMREVGVDRAVFFGEIVFPILKRVGLSRSDLMGAGAPSQALQAKG